MPFSLGGPTVRRGDQSSCTVIGPPNKISCGHTGVAVRLPQLIPDPLESASIFHRTSPIASGSGISSKDASTC